MKRKIAAVLAAGSLFLAFGLGEAVATKYTTNVQATYDYGKNLISGSVSSPESGCQADRKVTLYHQPGGDPAQQQKAGSGTTKDDGSYEITATVVPVIGDYWEIVAEEKTLRKGDNSRYDDDDRDALKRKKGKRDRCKSGRKRIPA